MEHGADWGELATFPDDGLVVADDREARSVVEEHRRQGHTPPPLGLAAGDLCRTLGGSGGPHRFMDGQRSRYAVDLGVVLLDGRIHWFLAHLVARRAWSRGPLLVAMNASWHGSWMLGPRAHPGDGLLDITRGDPPFRDRLRARRRLPGGYHLPHPDLKTARVPAFQDDLDPALDVWLDNERVARARTLSVRLEPRSVVVFV